MTRVAIPEKPYFKIGEVAELLAVKPSVLRYWETEFRTIRPEKTRTNQRLYPRRVVERLVYVRDLLYEQGFTIAGARKKLREGMPEAPAEPQLPLPHARPALPDGHRASLEKAKKELRELLQLCDE